MHEYKRFLWVAMMVMGTCVFGILLISILSSNTLRLQEIVTSYFIASLLFVPSAFIVNKYKLYLPNTQKYNLNSLIFSIIFGIGLLVAPKTSSATIKETIAMFGFEMITFIYFLVRKIENISS